MGLCVWDCIFQILYCTAPVPPRWPGDGSWGSALLGLGARARGENGQQFLGLEQAAPGVCSLGQRGCEGRAARRDRAQLTRPSEGGRWWGVVEGPHLLGENQAGPRIKEDSMQVAREGGDTFGSLMEVEGGFPRCRLVCPSQPGGH